MGNIFRCDDPEWERAGLRHAAEMAWGPDQEWLRATLLRFVLGHQPYDDLTQAWWEDHSEQKRGREDCVAFTSTQ